MSAKTLRHHARLQLAAQREERVIYRIAWRRAARLGKGAVAASYLAAYRKTVERERRQRAYVKQVERAARPWVWRVLAA